VVDFEEDRGRLVLVKVVSNDPVSRVLGCIQLDQDSDTLVRELRGEP